jgi:hypothetical protein
MASSIQQAQPPLEFIPPNLNLPLVRLLQAFLPVIMATQTAIREVEAENVDTLVDLYRQFQAGKVRFLMAFRHPSTDDPICLAYLLSRLVPQAARQQGVRLRSPIHAHFIYDRGIPLWAGARMGWLYSRLGGTPIQRGKIDRAGLRSARDLFVNGQLPMAAAPEGATNGHNELVSPLEPGISQLGFWCVEDLRAAGRPETVLLLPLGIKYRYLTPPWQQLEQLLTELETETGLTDPTTNHSLEEAVLYQRLFRLGEHLLSRMEDFYTRFYHQTLPTMTTPTAPDRLADRAPNQIFADRLNALLDVALTVAEQYFGLPPKGSVIDRCRRLEQAGWDWIYRDDINLGTLPPMDRGLADLIAQEAHLRLWHMRLVESFVAVTGQYVREKPSVERFAETTLLMWDMMARIKGNNAFKRPKLGPQTALLTIGQPLSVSDRWSAYEGGRRNAKQAIADLTQDLQTSLEEMAQAEG